MNPTSIRRALYGKMSADTTLTNLLATPPSGWSKSIFYGYAPDNASWPFVVFNKQSGTPTYANATKAALETDLWLVKAVDKNTTADRAEAVSTRLQDLLNDAGLSISGATELWLRREADVDYQEDTSDGRFVHSGSLFRLTFEPS